MIFKNNLLLLNKVNNKKIEKWFILGCNYDNK